MMPSGGGGIHDRVRVVSRPRQDPGAAAFRIRRGRIRTGRE